MEGLYYLCSENKGADLVFAYIQKSRFSHDAAHIISGFKTWQQKVEAAQILRRNVSSL